MTPAKFAALLDKKQKAEVELRRAFHKWEKLSAQIKRAEKTLDKKFAQRSDIGGEVDFRELSEEGMGGDAVLDRMVL